MFILQGLSVLIIAGSFFMLLKTQDKRWLYPLVIAGILCVWTPWKKEVTNIRTLERPVMQQELVEKREGDTETLEEKQQKLIKKAGENK